MKAVLSMYINAQPVVSKWHISFNTKSHCFRGDNLEVFWEIGSVCCIFIITLADILKVNAHFTVLESHTDDSTLSWQNNETLSMI